MMDNLTDEAAIKANKFLARTMFVTTSSQFEMDLKSFGIKNTVHVHFQWMINTNQSVFSIRRVRNLPRMCGKPQHDCAQNFLVLAVLSQVSSLHPRLALETVTLPLEVGLDQAPPPATALDTALAAGKLPGQTHPR